MTKQRKINPGTLRALKRDRARLGPYSRCLNRGAVGTSIDGRSWEGRFLRTLEDTLMQHVGGKPSAIQRLLISRLARIALRLELFDRKIDEGRALTALDGKVYGALQNSFARILAQLGTAPIAARTPSLQELLADDMRARARVGT